MIETSGKTYDVVYSIATATDTLFPEVWKCGVVFKYFGDHQSHLEFTHDGPGVISHTGYFSNFPSWDVTPENVEGYISALLKDEGISNYSITKENA